MVRPKFPHFTSGEADALQAFQNKYLDLGNWEYSVKFPVRYEERPEWMRPEEHRAIQHLTAKRADAVWHRERFIWIVEVKRVLRHSAIGELLTYRYFYLQQKNPQKAIRLIVIAEHDDFSLHPVLRELKIHWWTQKGSSELPERW
ncbi:MAG: hypothetical protein ACXABY_09550 [Candidatus Thorarchaeota archaeon]|jgi:hypothetical protein